MCRCFYHGVVLISTLVLALFSGNVHRCGLLLDSDPEHRALRQAALVAARGALTQSSYQTEHFAFWWVSTGGHAITGSAATVAPGDDIPRLVRVVSGAMEKAWRLYVDTLGYLPPKGSSVSYGWGIPVPDGKMPVEFGHVASLASYGDSADFIYGVSGPEGGGSGIVLASDITKAPNWDYTKDLDGKRVASDYARAWESVMQASAAHELFHSVQFRYDTRVNVNFLFESSAVAMERKAFPDETDYLSYLGKPPSSRVGLATLASLPSIYAPGGPESYEHGWFITQLMQDRGPNILRSLWEFNKTNKTSIQKTLRNVLRNDGWSLDSTLLRYSLRVGRTGLRSVWSIPSLAGFSDASMFPTLSGTLRPSERGVFSLPAGSIQQWVDTANAEQNRLVVWLPDPGVLMGRSYRAAAGTGWELCRGSTRLDSNWLSRNVWSISNAGPPENLPGATSSNAKIRLWIREAPNRSAASPDAYFRWTSGDGVVISGISTLSGGVTPLAHLDAWTPDPSIEEWAARFVGASGHAVVVEDADRRLVLSNAAVKLPFSAEQVFVGRGNGEWAPIASRTVAGGTEVDMSELDLTTPIRFLMGQAAPRVKVFEPFGNPSRGGKPIRFPVSGSSDEGVLQILAQDGSCVRRLKTRFGVSEVVWDLRNESGEQVRPGVYWFVWVDVEGVKKGALLVGQ